MSAIINPLSQSKDPLDSNFKCNTFDEIRYCDDEYKHLSAEERAVIMIEKARNTSVRAIAGPLDRSASTITRELARNRTEAPRCYGATSAARAYRTRRERSRRRAKLAAGSTLYWRVHHDLVYRCWSPQQIAAKLREMHPDNPEQRVSHETIYAAIYTHPRGGLKQAMINALRQEKPVRGNARKTLARKSFVPEELRILHRPEAIETRQWPGHWEGDLIKGPSIVPASAHWSSSRRASRCWAA